VRTLFIKKKGKKKKGKMYYVTNCFVVSGETAYDSLNQKWQEQRVPEQL
jgi:hypothetical protein